MRINVIRWLLLFAGLSTSGLAEDINQAQKTLNDAKTKFEKTSKEYEDAIDKYQKEEAEKKAKGEEVSEETQKELDEAAKKLTDATTALQSAQGAFDRALKAGTGSLNLAGLGSQLISQQLGGTGPWNALGQMGVDQANAPTFVDATGSENTFRANPYYGNDNYQRVAGEVNSGRMAVTDDIAQGALQNLAHEASPQTATSSPEYRPFTGSTQENGQWQHRFDGPPDTYSVWHQGEPNQGSYVSQHGELRPDPPPPPKVEEVPLPPPNEPKPNPPGAKKPLPSIPQGPFEGLDLQERKMVGSKEVVDLKAFAKKVKWKKP